MTTAGWIIMFSALTAITGLFAWCVWKVVSTPGATEHLHAPPDIDTRD